MGKDDVVVTCTGESGRLVWDIDKYRTWRGVRWDSGGRPAVCEVHEEDGGPLEGGARVFELGKKLDFLAKGWKDRGESRH